MCAAMTKLVIKLSYFFSYKTFPSKTMPKNLDPSPDGSRSLGLFRKGSIHIIVKFHMTDLLFGVIL